MQVVRDFLRLGAGAPEPFVYLAQRGATAHNPFACNAYDLVAVRPSAKELRLRCDECVQPTCRT
eukprot:SAG11_NODE_7534_length_1134_cov_0.929469_2_plen_64_part_00